MKSPAQMSETPAESIYASLRGRILEGAIPEGQRLVVSTLAREYGVSDFPVRQALHLLQRDALITIHHNRGARVVVLTADDIVGTCLLRGELEALATRLAGPNLTLRDFSVLDSMLEDMGAAAAEGDGKGYFELNRAFHTRVFDRCPYAAIQEQLARTWDSSIAYGRVFTLDETRMGISMQEHREIVSLLRSSDWDTAADVARRHKHGLARSLLETMGEAIPEPLQERPRHV